MKLQIINICKLAGMLFCSLHFYPFTFGQTSSSYSQTIGFIEPKRLQIGDKIPDILFNQVVNYEKASIRLSDFRGKLLLLDFWNMNCSPCVAALPELKRLQQKYYDRLMVLPVCMLPRDKQEQFPKFLERRKVLGKAIDLPIAINYDFNEAKHRDSLIEVLFNISFVPYQVWINEEGYIVAFTDGLFVEENIQKHLHGQKIETPAPNSQKTFDFDKPILTNGNGGPDTAFKYRSLITNYIDSFTSSGFKRIKTDRMTRLFYGPEPIVNLYLQAYGALYNPETGIFLDVEVKLDVKDSSKYKFPDPNLTTSSIYYEKLKSNLFHYELILPPSFELAEAYQIMIDDLNRFFKLKSSIEKKKLPTYVLKTISGMDKLYTTGGSPKVEYDYKTNFSFTNLPISVLIDHLTTKWQMIFPYVMDETGYKNNNLDISINVDRPLDIDSLNRELHKNGLKLVREIREREVLILSERRQ